MSGEGKETGDIVGYCLTVKTMTVYHEKNPVNPYKYVGING